MRLMIVEKDKLRYLYMWSVVICIFTTFLIVLHIESMNHLNDRLNLIIKDYLTEANIEDISKEKIKEIIDTEDASISHISVIELGGPTSKKVTYEINFEDKIKRK